MRSVSGFGDAPHFFYSIIQKKPFFDSRRKGFYQKIVSELLFRFWLKYNIHYICFG